MDSLPLASPGKPLDKNVHGQSRFSGVQLFVTLWTRAHQAPLSMGFSIQEYWSRLPCSPPGDIPESEIEPMSVMSPALADEFFTTSTTWEALKYTISTPQDHQIQAKSKKLSQTRRD